MGLFILIAFIVILFLIKKKGKTMNFGSMVLISGGVKCGKTTLAVYKTISTYNGNLFRWKVHNFIQKLLPKKFRKLDEKPLLYSNIPLKVDYVQLTPELLQRKKRFAYGSVVYISEASLVADSMMYKDAELNEQLLLFNKLIGHELRGKGGTLIYDTQTVSDCHFSIKRSLSTYFYVHHLTKWIPFFLIAHVIECRYSDDGSVTSADIEDVESRTKWLLVPKSTWKKFDAYCYSYLTDDLPVENKVIPGKTVTELRAKYIVSFRKWINQLVGGKNDEKKA